MSETDTSTSGHADGVARALAAVAVIAQELSRREPNWNALRVLCARLLEICDRMDRGIALDVERED